MGSEMCIRDSRTDEYGGSFENRLRFLLECATAVRDAIGDKPVLGLRISDEEDRQGLQQSECLEAVQALSRVTAFDYYNVCAGSSATTKAAVHIVPSMVHAAGYVAPFARTVKGVTNVPVFVTGRINQPHEAEAIIARGDADVCGMTRAMISDPEMPAKAAADRADDIRACVACNQACIGHLYLGAGISCIQNPTTGRELEFRHAKSPLRSRRLVVIGGGPAGMKAASVAAARGHTTILCERGRQLGGQVLLAQLLPRRAEFGGVITNLKREVELTQVDVRLRTEVTSAFLRNLEPEEIIVAVGAEPYVPPLELSGGRQLLKPREVLLGDAACGNHVAIVDWKGDWIGVGLAEKLIQEGHRVTYVTSSAMPAINLMAYIRDQTVNELAKSGVQFITYARLFGADEGAVYCENTFTGDPIEIEDVDSLIVSFGNATQESYEEFHLPGVRTQIVGDAQNPRTVEEAVLEAQRAAYAID